MIWHQQISFRKEGAEKLSPFRKGNIGEEKRKQLLGCVLSAYTSLG